MEEYIVSARKYRPMSFDSVVGQTALTTTLKNAVKSGKLAHAYLFCGPRGVGKTTCARIFAKAINCEHPHDDGEACNQCENCNAFNEQRSYNIFELDAASNNSVENIKALMDQTRIAPQVGRYKVFIIDEVHMLSTAAFNAFLKTLEEPPAHVIFILATTEKHKILPTILSRCQIYDFERMSTGNTIAHLKHVAQKEGITYDERALEVIAEKADGGMRDALSIFDQVVSFCQGNLTYENVIKDLNVLDTENYFRVIDFVLENKVSDIMLLLNGVIARGFDAGNFVNGLASHVRNVLMAKDAQTLPLLEAGEAQKQHYQEQAAKCPVKFMYQALRLLNQCDINYRQSSNKRLLAELTLIQVAQLMQPDDEAVGARQSRKRLKTLFKKRVVSTTKPAIQVAGVGNTPAPASVVSASPAVGTTTKPAAQPRMKMGQLGVTFNSLRKSPTKGNTQEEVKITNADETTVFNDEQVQLQWMSMCNRMPQKMKGIASRMKNMQPHITVFPQIEVTVDNQILLNDILNIKARIKATMAQALHNGQIELNIRLATPEEVGRILNKREIFEEVLKANPAIEKLRTALNLELT